ncbi:MAG TPA: ISNCY family transposase, partial [Paenibacillaceae bacterium]
MSKEQMITLTKEELKRVMVLEQWIDGRLTEQDVSRILKLSVRQVYRLKAKYVHGGAQTIAHGNRGRKPAHALTDPIKQHVQRLYQERYYGSNCTHFTELLAEYENIRLSVSSVRRILIQGGLRPARVRRRSKVHRPRPRKAQAGMLWQIDASPFAWLEDRGPQLVLHAIIDDATGEVLAAVFRLSETLEGYVTVMIEALRRKGVPLALYSDKHSIFCPPKGKPTLEQELAGQPASLTTFGQAIADLGITHIEALTPQAKGRIERLWRTFQDRLVIELRLRNVCTMEEANRVLPELIDKHNRLFAVAPQEAEPACRPLPEVPLEHIFARRVHRRISGGQTFSWQGKCYMPQPGSGVPRWEAKAIVEVRIGMQGQVWVWHQGRAWPCVEAPQVQTSATSTVKKTAAPAPPRKPAANHPWRKPFSSKQYQRSTASGHQARSPG